MRLDLSPGLVALATAFTPLEWAAALTAAAGLLLAVRNSAWNWPLTLVSCALYYLFFRREHLLADAALQLGYAALCVVGWVRWVRGTGEVGAALPITRAPRRELRTLAALTVVGSGLWAWVLMRYYPHAAVPWVDAPLAVLSLAGQWLLARKRLENWLVWLFADSAYVVLYAVRGYWPTVALFVGLLGLAALGWRQWRRELARAA